MPFDSRAITIPAFLTGAAALAIGLLAGLLRLAPDGYAFAGGGLALMVFAVGLSHLLDRAPAPATRAAGRSAFAAVAVALVLAVGIGVGAATVEPTAHDEAGPGAASVADDAAGAFARATETFSGSVGGASVPVLGQSVGGAPYEQELALAPGSTAARVELHWTPAQTGSASLTLVVEAEEDGEWVEVERASGASPLTVDALALASPSLRVTVLLPEGSAATEQPFEGYATGFDGAIPSGFTAHEA